ncbi:MAG TPA: ABC transporter permease, partial [Candidatus Elarobacter sp.]|nr:ABC transporter permease [Candidatus Elarobacter sp.]
MLRFFAGRLVRLVGVLVAITVASFLFMHAIPGDPVTLRLGEHASPAEIAHLRAATGLDRPLIAQLAIYLGAVARGDLGASVFDAQPVAQKLAQYFPATVELT